MTPDNLDRLIEASRLAEVLSGQSVLLCGTVGCPRPAIIPTTGVALSGDPIVCPLLPVILRLLRCGLECLGCLDEGGRLRDADLRINWSGSRLVAKKVSQSYSLLVLKTRPLETVHRF